MGSACPRRSRLGRAQKLGGPAMFTPQIKAGWVNVMYGVVPFCLRFILSPGGKSPFTQVEVCADRGLYLIWEQKLNGYKWQLLGPSRALMPLDRLLVTVIAELHAGAWQRAGGQSTHSSMHEGQMHHTTNKGQHRLEVSVGTEASPEPRNGQERPLAQKPPAGPALTVGDPELAPNTPPQKTEPSPVPALVPTEDPELLLDAPPHMEGHHLGLRETGGASGCTTP